MPPLSDIAVFLNAQALHTPPRPQNVDLVGKTVLITGANTGLGLDAAKHLARMKASRLILACRNIKKGEAAKQTIFKETKCKGLTNIEVWEVDLDHYNSVTAFTHRVRQSSELDRLDAVVANAGIELTDFELSEGVERTLNINVISTYLLCLGVLPKLEESAREYAVPTKLCLTGSLIHFFGSDKELHTVPAGQEMFAGLSDSRTTSMSARYPLTKLVEHLCFNQLIKHHSGNVSICIVNPGWCGTELFRNKPQPASERFFFSILGRTSEEGSRTLVHGVTSGKETHGKYLSECGVARQSTYVNSAKGQAMSQRLWKDLMARLEKIDPVAADAISK